MASSRTSPKLSKLDTAKALWRVSQEILKQPFTTDGCTNWPDGLWLPCCTTHDYYYQYGIALEIKRKEADKRLRRCVADMGYPMVAWIMYAGVRTFGGLLWRRHKEEYVARAARLAEDREGQAREERDRDLRSNPR